MRFKVINFNKSREDLKAEWAKIRSQITTWRYTSMYTYYKEQHNTDNEDREFYQALEGIKEIKNGSD